MGIFSFLSRKQHKRNDDFWGEMNFISFKNDAAKNYFECRRHFLPAGDIIPVGVAGDMTSSLEAQTKFFAAIEHNYSTITKSIIPMVEEEFRNWKEAFTIKNFGEEFKPVYLSIPRCEEQPIVWEIAFETVHDGDHHITLTMNDWKAMEVLVDG